MIVRRRLLIALVLIGATAAARGTATTSDGLIEAFAGGGLGDGGPALSGALNQPRGLALGSGGALFVAQPTQCRTRRILNGGISSVAGRSLGPLVGCGFSGDGGPAIDSALHDPNDVAVDAAGNIFIADGRNGRIRRIDAASGVITTVAGNTINQSQACASPADGSVATDVQLCVPVALALGSDGSIYVATQNDCSVYRITLGLIYRFAGIGGCGFSPGTGVATALALNRPSALAIDTAGAVYIADQWNCRIRKVVEGIVTTVLGVDTEGSAQCAFNGDGLPPLSTKLDYPAAIAVDGQGSLYIGERCRIRKLSTTIVTTRAGTGTCGLNASTAVGTVQFNDIRGLALDSVTGVLYVSDSLNCLVRSIVGGQVNRVAGTGECFYGGDGGAPEEATMSYLTALAVDPDGRVYVGDQCRVRRITTATVETVAGNGRCENSPDGVAATSVGLGNVMGLAVASSGDLYISDYWSCRVRKVSAGIITTFAGNGVCGFAGDGGAPEQATLSLPAGLALDRFGALYIADSNNGRVRRVKDGVIETVAGNSCVIGLTHGDGCLRPMVLAFDQNDDLYISGLNCVVSKLTQGRLVTIAGSYDSCGYWGDELPATFSYTFGAEGIAVSPAGSVYFSDGDAFFDVCVVRQVVGGIIDTVAGNPSACGDAGDGGAATAAKLWNPRGLVFLDDTTLLLAQGSGRLRKVTIDRDRDDDGVEDQADNCPTVSNNQSDLDGDGWGDVCEVLLYLTSPMLADTDGDSCNDRSESQPDPFFGGARDPVDSWDFFDANDDARIDLSDALTILASFGSQPGQQAYKPRLDRYAPDIARPWLTKAAVDGTGIDLTDVLVNLASFGHECSGPP